MLKPFNRRPDPGMPARLTAHRNDENRSYEENHLEEWTARQPASLFGSHDVMILGSQNYAHMPQKIDLLFVDRRRQLYVVEIKVEPVAKNGGVVPYTIYQVQMKTYVDFVKTCLQLEDLGHDYERFSKESYGQPLDLLEQYTKKFGTRLGPRGPLWSTICEIYVAPQFDEYALRYIFVRSKADARNARLIFYKFYPLFKYIEFWEHHEEPEV